METEMEMEMVSWSLIKKEISLLNKTKYRIITSNRLPITAGMPLQIPMLVTDDYSSFFYTPVTDEKLIRSVISNTYQS